MNFIIPKTDSVYYQVHIMPSFENDKWISIQIEYRNTHYHLDFIVMLLDIDGKINWSGAHSHWPKDQIDTMVAKYMKLRAFS
jgi:regulation of enolase protein 1 (concanavalin A-like superfamily)